ncbi:kelch repeat [Fusarium heterosporum]|uniref:Kelch repeat n=1 Tax=Fusarium heterosporum TaxID=42747 RepID=A0A8H5WXD6_FUSHE|nr:kelch repeat [Fusarium heterosporum]
MQYVITLLVAFTHLISSCPAVCLESRSVQVPESDSFLRRALLSIAVLNDYVYVEGGEVSSENDFGSTPVGVTLSISLKESWTNDTVTLDEIDKGSSPYLKQPALWVDNSSSTIFSWGGQGSYDNVSVARDHHLWAFRADDSGKGTWSIQDPRNSEAFRSSYRTVRGASTTCNGVGYYLGGYAERNSDRRITEGSRVFDGLLTYNMTTQQWSNESTEALGYATWSGSATCLPSIGPAGLILFLGGSKGGVSARSNESDPVSFTNVTIYDPNANNWYWQSTTGGPPESRVDFCSVGVPGKNGTFEIFIYGGWNAWNTNTKSYGDVWVLTLPAFRWFKADHGGPARAMHGCALVGNCQMISIGGNDNREKGGWRDKDPWQQGIGILDLPSMTWSERYDANGAEYDSPRDLRVWYSNGAQVQWDNDEVKKLFAQTAPPGEENSSSKPSKSSAKPIGAIVGGVVGGVVLLIAIMVIVIFKRRSRKGSTEKSSGNTSEGWNKAELPGDSQGAVLRHELDSDRQHLELPVAGLEVPPTKKPGQRYELEG